MVCVLCMGVVWYGCGVVLEFRVYLFQVLTILHTPNPKP